MQSAVSTHSRGFILVIAGLGLVGLLFHIQFAGQFLVVNQPPEKSDAIIVLGGEIMDRIQQGVQLYNAGYAPLLVLSGGNLFTEGTTESEVMASIAERMGISSKHIILESKSKSTYDNALFTKRILLDHKLKSAIVVSSNYHMRRVQLIFNQVYRGTGITLIYSAAMDRGFQPNHWWSNAESFHITISEYIKMAATLIGIK